MNLINALKDRICLDKAYFALFAVMLLYIVVPWAYFDSEIYKHIFIPKKVLLILIGLLSAVIVLLTGQWKKSLIIVSLGAIYSGLAYLFVDYYEKHYIIHLIYLEIAFLIVTAPKSIRKKFLKYSRGILPILLIKFFVFRNGNYIHGGYFSSNLFSAFVLYVLMMEIFTKSFASFLLGASALMFIGSKSVYISIFVFILYLFLQKVTFVNKLLVILFSSFYRLLITVFIVIGLFTFVIVNTNYHGNWLEEMDNRRENITKRNLKRRGLIDRSFEDLKKDFDSKQRALLVENPVSDIDTSLNLRLSQYKHMFKEIHKYFFFGDIYRIAYRAFGYNPHNSVLDFISRLGVLFFVGTLILYKGLYLKLNIVFINIIMFPILLYQPFGYTLGHGFLVFVYYYSLVLSSERPSKWKLYNGV